jgi:tetratricopeptide (TPR) repeat protein
MSKTSSTRSQPFIGRATALANICGRIDEQQGVALISVQGHGGVGKTYLIREIYEQYHDKQGFLCFTPIDFYQVRNRNIRWVMSSLAAQVPNLFPTYLQMQRYAEASSGARSTQPITTIGLAEAFHIDLTNIERRYRCIMLFDTIELIQETVVTDLLHIIGSTHNCVFVLAGRQNQELLPSFQQHLGDYAVLTIPLIGFSEPDAMEYIQQMPAGRALAEHEQMALYMLADNGVPIKLALALDWLARGMALQSLISSPYERLKELRETNAAAFRERQLNFERELVVQIADLGSDLDRAVHMMAHTRMRFNRELLIQLLHPDDPDKLMTQLSNLPFVRQIGNQQILVLHDEVQRMIVHNIWDLEDPANEERRQISEAVIAYYNQAIQQCPADTSDSTLVDELRIECLYYQLHVDVVEGYHNFSTIFEQHKDSREQGDIEIAALALDVLLRDSSLPARLRDFVGTYHRGWILTRRTDLKQAQECIASGLKRLETVESRSETVTERRDLLEREVDRRIGEIYTLHGYTYRLAGEWSEAVRWYERARKFNEGQIDALASQNPQTFEEQQRAISRLAETLNDIANLQRMQGNLDDARLYCKTSLVLRRALKETLRSGHSCYVMSMILWESGNTSEVLSYLRMARAYYREAGSETLERAWVDRYRGYVMYRTGYIAEAIECLNEALKAADKANLAEEQAQCLLIFSRINRDKGEINDLIEAQHNADEALIIAKRAANDYIIAECHLTLCLTIKEIIRRTSDTPDYDAAFKEHFSEGVAIVRRHTYTRLLIRFQQIEADNAFGRSDYRRAFADYLGICRMALAFKPSVFHRALSDLTNRLYELLDLDPNQTVRACRQIRQGWNTAKEPDENYRGLISTVDEIEKLARHQLDRTMAAKQFEDAFHRGAWEEALSTCDQADAISIDQHVERAEVMRRRAEIYHSRNQLAQARLYADQAMRTFERLRNPSSQLADSYLLLGKILWKLGMTTDGAQLFRKAEAQYETIKNSGVGLGLVYTEQAYAAFRARLFDEARRLLDLALRLFRREGAEVHEAAALNMLSRIERIDPGSVEQRISSYEIAERYSDDALLTLRDRDWFSAAEIHLTLCILYFVWGQVLYPTDPQQAEEKFHKAVAQNARGQARIAQIESPMLKSVLSGMQANLLLIEGDRDGACKAFLNELVAATRTKHMRLMRALDLLEDFLVSESSDLAQDHARWFIQQWHELGLDHTYLQVSRAIQWIIDHQRYVLLAQRGQDARIYERRSES